jgi:oligo-1,6-glucosidase
MRQEVLSKYDILTVGETPLVNTQNGLDITHEESGALNMVFQFQHMELDVERDRVTAKRSRKPWRLLELKEIMTRWQKDLAAGGWNSIYLDNHDQPRALSRFGDDGRYRAESAKMLATFIHMLQGTPYIYQGDEIGMTNVAFPSIADYRDVATHNMYRELVEGRGMSSESVMAMIHATSRDNARTPMQWDDNPQAGFSTGEPWIKVNPNYTEINVEQALADPDSVFYYYQKLIRLRKEHPIIVYGTYDLILEDDEQIYAFTRTLADEQLLVMLNFKAETAVFTLPSHLDASHPELLISNYDVDPDEDISQLALQPYEARVYRLKG